MALPTTYNAGTATIAANDVAVTGQNTTWSTSGIQAGDLFMAAGLTVPIAAVNSNTSITLADPWPGAARNTASYRIQFTPDATRVLASTRAVLDALTNGVLYAIASLQTAADKIAYFTGQGTAALTSFTSFARSLVGAVDAPAARAVLQLGTAATVGTGTSGAAIGRLDTINSWGQEQTFPGVSINGAATAYRATNFKMNGSQRWVFGAQGGTEAGGNVGSNLVLLRYDDSGTFMGTPFWVNRQTGEVNVDTLVTSIALKFGGTAAATSRANLGLGSAATYNVATSGANVPILSALNTWYGEQKFSTVGRSWHSILSLIADNPGSYANIIQGMKGGDATGNLRWQMHLGSYDAGFNFLISRFADNGDYLGDAMKITRSTGIVNFYSAPSLPSFTVATLPSAAANPQGIVYVSNGTSNKRFAVSDGTSWRFPDGAIVS